MDANKARKLQEIGYEALNTCGSCVFGDFKGDTFGVCLNFTYSHQKHSVSTRELSIRVDGVCPSYERDRGLSGGWEAYG